MGKGFLERARRAEVGAGPFRIIDATSMPPGGDHSLRPQRVNSAALTT